MVTEHAIDARSARCLLPPVGRVIVEMLPEAERIGTVFLPEIVAGKFRPDVGIVLACGPDVSLSPGDTVCVRGYDGQWIEEFDAGYRTRNQVRVYGKASRFQGELLSTPWSESIPLQIVQEGEDLDLIATHHNVVIRREPVVQEERGFFLPDSAQYRTGMATILSMGPLCDLVTEDGPAQVGDRVFYDSRGELDFAFGADPDLAIVPDLAINCIVRSKGVEAS
jgi:co-chaperonin GroES (HSP10)